eukprot:413467-Rhodomonas_salina.1
MSIVMMMLDDDNDDDDDGDDDALHPAGRSQELCQNTQQHLRAGVTVFKAQSLASETAASELRFIATQRCSTKSAHVSEPIFDGES